MFSFVTTPDRFPHRCLSCGGGAGTDREWYVDFGENLEGPEENFLWTIYICNLCLIAIAGEKGIVPRASLDAEIELLKSQLFDQTTKAEGLEIAVDGLFRARLFKPDDVLALELGVHVDSSSPEESGFGVGPGAVEVSGEQLHTAAGEVIESNNDLDLAGLRSTVFLDGGPT